MTYIKPGAEETKEISLGEIRDYFYTSGKPKEKHRYGLECEIFGLCAKTAEPIPYFGTRGVEGVLKTMAADFGWHALEERGHVVALERKGDSITLEPGGQVELSAAPVKTLAEIDVQVKSFHRELKAVGEKLHVRWLSIGAHPCAMAGQMPWVPKARYEIMRRYLARHGARSHDMMQRTATNQFNIDFVDERDAVEIMQIVFRLTPFVVAAFAHSPIFEGRISGYQSYRNHIWHGTAPERSGLIQTFVENGGSFEAYINYILDMPMLFILRGGEWIPLNGLSFRTFLEKGFDAHRATRTDFELHVSTIFPECRLKDHIEIRGLDAQAPDFILASCAFWKGILATPETRKAALEEVSTFTWHEISAFYRELPQKGLGVRVDARTAGSVNKKLFQTALFGLAADKKSGAGDARYLELFFDRYVRQERTPADEVIAAWQTHQEGSCSATLNQFYI